MRGKLANGFVWLCIVLFIASVLASVAVGCGKNGSGPTIQHPANSPGYAAPDDTPFRSADAPQTGDDNLPWSVQVSVGAADVTVTWRGRARGDFDLDGTVAIADITPLAMHYGDDVLYTDGMPVVDGDNEYLAVVDGDDSGEIGIADITPIAMHYGQTNAGYRIYLGLRATGETEMTWTADFLKPTGNPDAVATVPFEDSRIELEVQRYTFTFEPPAEFEGYAALRITATDGETEGATYETEPFSLSTMPDTEPPYRVSGIESLEAEPDDGSVTLTWGEWTDDATPPVVIELAWEPAPMTDPDDALHSHSLYASPQEYMATDLDNGVEYEFACRFGDSADPPNYTPWLESTLATPDMVLYRMPPPGADDVSGGAAISPSLAAFIPDEHPPSALYEDYAPALAYIAVNGATDRPLVFARYSGGWQANTIGEGEYAACSLALINGAPAIAAANSATGEIELHSADAELTDWEMEPVHAATPSALELLIQRDALGEPVRLCVVYTTGASPAYLHIAVRDASGGNWDVETSPAISDTVFSFNAIARPGADTLEAIASHGTATPQELALDTTIQYLCFGFTTTGWTSNDYVLPPAGDDDRYPLGVSLRVETAPYLLAATGVVRYSTVLTYEIPFGDILASGPTDFSGGLTWMATESGITLINPFSVPPTITVDWATYPVWTGESLARMVFVRLKGDLEVSLNPLGITGGAIEAEWWDAWTTGAIWSVSELEGNPPGGLSQSPAPSGDGAQMAYVQIDSIDLEELLSGTPPEGSIYYWRETSGPMP